MEDKVAVIINGTEMEMDTSPVSYGVCSSENGEYIMSEKARRIGLGELGEGFLPKLYLFEKIFVIASGICIVFWIFFFYVPQIVDIINAYSLGEDDRAIFRLGFFLFCCFGGLIWCIPFIFVLPHYLKIKKLKKTYRVAKLPIAKVICTGSYKNNIPGYKIVVDNPDKIEGFLDYYCTPTFYSSDFEVLKEGDLVSVCVMREKPEVFYFKLKAAVRKAKKSHTA